MEKWYYRHSNFQNWCTAENSDSFTYIGCHYVDLVHFITGLLPAVVSVYGIRDRYPNGSEGFLWADARVLWNNGACLNVQTSLSFPDDAPGTNTQGLVMYFSGADCRGEAKGGYLHHSDQYRGIAYSYLERPDSPGATAYTEPSADYFQYVDLGGPGLVPVGYGYRSVEYIVEACKRVEAEGAGLPESEAVERRRRLLRQLDETGVMATPANSRFNELVIEAGRLSILNGGREVQIDCGPADGVRFKEYLP
jgi:predicted dehydrogenase